MKETSKASFEIPPLIPGDGRTLLSAAAGNQLIKRLNALSRLKVQRGAADEFRLSDANAILTIARDQGTTGGGSGNMSYRGAYNDVTDYEVDDVVIHPNTAGLGVVRTLWICLIANGPASAVHQPEIPEPGLIVAGTRYWQALAYFDNFAGEYSSYSGGDTALRINYTRGQIVYTGSTGGRLAWFCMRENGPDVTSVGVQIPEFPEPVTPYWLLLAGNPTPAFKWCQIQAIKQDHYEVKEWDGSDVTGDTFNVAKNTKLRGSITGETIDGVAVSYSAYTATTYVARTASDGTNSEKQVIVPRLLGSDLIWAAEVDQTGVEVSSVEVTWLDINIDGRAWARKFDQS